MNDLMISVAIERPSVWEKREQSDNRRGGHDMCLAMDEIEADA